MHAGGPWSGGSQGGGVSGLGLEDMVTPPLTAGRGRGGDRGGGVRSGCGSGPAAPRAVTDVQREVRGAVSLQISSLTSPTAPSRLILGDVSCEEPRDWFI